MLQIKIFVNYNNIVCIIQGFLDRKRCEGTNRTG